jgi:hypothetical protein
MALAFAAVASVGEGLIAVALRAIPMLVKTLFQVKKNDANNKKFLTYKLSKVK